MTSLTSVMLPIIRKVVPSLIAEELVSVQPMTNVPTGLWTMKCRTRTLEEILWVRVTRKVGVRRHVFSGGWQSWSGTEWIEDDLYWFLKIKGVM